MIFLKSPREVEIMRRASQIVAEVLEELKGTVVPGITTLDMDALAEEQTRKTRITTGACAVHPGTPGRYYPQAGGASDLPKLRKTLSPGF